MANALKLITCNLIGTLLAIAIAGVVIEDWVDHKINEVSVMVDYKINNVLTTPARAATNAWESLKQAAGEIFQTTK
ncbi:MAG: hypothetical protein R3C59_09505 [Planctomycetaceae bacterium]